MIEAELLDPPQLVVVETDCGICGAHFTKKSSLTRHLMIHQEGLIKCRKCSQCFKTEADKRKHIEDKHAPVICETCGKTFGSKSYLEYHTKTHNKDGHGDDSTLLKCPFPNCEKIFRQKARQEDHINSHTGLKPYSCERCQKTFACRFAKKEHVPICSNEKEIKCDECGTAFNHRASLRNHEMAAHSGQKFTCSCGRSFKYRSGFGRHKKETGHMSI